MSGVITARVANDLDDPRVTIDLVDSSDFIADLTIDFPDDQPRSFDALTIGVPHLVTIVDNADDFADYGQFHAYGKQVRHHSACAPAGANVNVVHLIDDHTLRMRTCKRGVEAETIACGTGAAASAIALAAQGFAAQPVTIITSSGRPIIVSFDLVDRHASSIQIIGEARFVASGEFHPESWQ